MDSIPLIGPGLTGLQEARPAGVFPFLAEGESLWVRGVASRPDLQVGRVDRVLATIRAEGMGSAANILVFPGMARRDFSSSGGTVVETVLATPTLPLAIVQWEGTRSALPGSILVRLHEATASPTLTDDAAVVVEGRPGEGAREGTPSLRIGLAPPASQARVEVVDGMATVVLEPTAADHLSLVVALEGADGRRTPMAEAKHARSHAVRAAAGPADGLSVLSGVPEIANAVAWLRVRLAGQARHFPVRQDPYTGLFVGLAATAVGDRTSSRTVLSSMATDSTEYALLAARHAATFGETSPARQSASAWGGRPLQPSALVALTARELADALHHAADAATLSRLRAVAEAPADPRDGSPDDGTESGRYRAAEGRSLPMAGRPSSPGGGSSNLTGPSSASADRPVEAVDLRRLLAPRPGADDPDAAWAAWRNALVDGSGRVMTLWDGWQDTGVTVPRPDAVRPAGRGRSRTAGLLLDLTAGILGLRADAPAGRISIAPSLPSHIRRFEASGITLGTNTLGLRYAVTPEAVRYELVPEASSVPPLVIFEPSMSTRPEGVRIDGETAELDPRRSGSRTVVPVQLPLDKERVVELIRSPTR